MFRELCIETASMCNRTCPSCLRQSYPDREAVSFRTRGAAFMPLDTFHRIIDEAAEMGFAGTVNLQFWNEPLMDARFADLLAYVWRTRYRAGGRIFERIQFCSNADLLSPVKAASIDGLADHIVFALYGPEGGDDLGETRETREAEIRSWFHISALTFLGPHMTTHFSPERAAEVGRLVAENRDRPCVPEAGDRLIIDHRGEMLLCCEDVVGEWGLGNVSDFTLSELWYDKRHVDILETLARPGGRSSFSHCRVCPRI